MSEADPFVELKQRQRRDAGRRGRRSPAATPANVTSRPATGVVKVAVGANEDHIARCRCLSSTNGSASLMTSTCLTVPGLQGPTDIDDDIAAPKV